MTAIKKSITVVKRPRESFALSFARDLVTFSWLILCIWISRESAWWTFFTAGMTICFGGARAIAWAKEHSDQFETWEALIEWAKRQREESADE